MSERMSGQTSEGTSEGTNEGTSEQRARRRTSRPSSRVLIVTGLVLSLLIAGVISFYASGNPDGLEYVAEEVGFMDTAEDSAVADSPLADYGVAGVEDSRLSGGLAGVIGVAATALIAFTLMWLVRRRGTGRDT